MTSEQIRLYVQGLEASVEDYRAWDEARRMVIGYLKKEHGLEDPYQWAFKTIELFEELKKLKQ